LLGVYSAHAHTHQLQHMLQPLTKKDRIDDFQCQCQNR